MINLRGGNPNDAWYREERDICGRMGVDHIDIGMSAIRAPHPTQLNRLLNAFDNARYPILYHCQGGADRSGLAGAIYLNVYQNVPLDEAETPTTHSALRAFSSLRAPAPWTNFLIGIGRRGRA